MTERILILLRLCLRAIGRLYPVDFRNRFLPDMRRTFDEEYRRRASRSAWSALSYGVHSLAATAIVAVTDRAGEWRRPRGRRGSPASPGSSGPGLVREARHALRALRRSPGFTMAALLTMAIAIGVTTAVFSLVDGVLLRPLPYPEPDRLVRLFQQSGPANRWNLSAVDYQAIVEQQRSFESVAAILRGEATVTGEGEPARLRAGWVAADWFSMLGVRPEVGRAFRPEEDHPDAAPVVVLGWAVAERYFGTPAASVGRSLTIDGRSFEVIGVLSPDVSSMAGWRADLWPILRLETPTRRGPFFLQPVARLGPDVSLEAAAADLAGISRRIFPIWAEGFQDSTARLTPVPLKEVIIGDVDRALYLLLGAVGFVLLIAVANVANLQLARASAREHEVAVRTALGARRGTVARQLLVESLLLALVGGALGIGLARVTLTLLVGLGPRLPRLGEVALDHRVLLFTAAITLGSGILFGLAPMIHALKADPAGALRRGGRGGTKLGSRGASALVVAEFALAVPLLAGAMLLLISLGKLQRVDAGFDPAGLSTARISLPQAVYRDGRARIDFWERALEEVARVPGVSSAAIATGVPPDAPWDFNNFDLVDRPVPQGTPQPMAPWLAVSPNFFETLGVPLLAGRTLAPGDTTTDPVVVVSRSWAERFYAGESPLGRILIEGGCTWCPPTTVVGVVGDVAYEGLGSEAPIAVYSPYAQRSWPTAYLLVRGSRGGVPMDAVRRAVASLDRTLPLADVATMEERLGASVARPRYWSLLVGAFAAVGLVLAGVGIYGVLSNFVVRQRRDIGIRMALGARPVAVLGLVVRRGMAQAGLGLALGLVGAFFLTRAIEGLLFGVSAADPATFAGVALVLAAVALAACLGPARRATAVDPVRVLSEE